MGHTVHARWTKGNFIHPAATHLAITLKKVAPTKDSTRAKPCLALAYSHKMTDDIATAAVSMSPIVFYFSLCSEVAFKTFGCGFL